ncbi:BTAD domain-containing putative transcriptional regulator [Streptomyces massasporeus]|uniref:BTAD domain-containing putative transcriptional regulator n=1 Tax=Streptomyces massasporeus TaxID=67324 RepID=UPI0033E19C71
MRGLSGEYPLCEHSWAQRMLALFHCGRRGEALESYREVTALLADELGVAPGTGLRQVHQRLPAAAPDPIGVQAAGAAPPSRDGQLPAEMTTFVGRETQVAEVRRLLGTVRLVTLTGVGGVGKTRLALRTAAEAAPSFTDGVRLADLAPLSDAAQWCSGVVEERHGEAQRASPPCGGPWRGSRRSGTAGVRSGPGDTGPGGGGHRRRHPGGAAPRRSPPLASGHGGGADRPAPVPRGASHRRATGARVPGAEEYAAAWSRGASAEDAPGPVPEDGLSRVRSTHTRTSGSHTPTA